MKIRKAQAAIEFLTTYGWALLVIALILVALGWLGVFSPQNAIGQLCQFPIGTFQCNDVKLSSNGAGAFPEVLDVTNNFGRTIHVCGVHCSAQQPDPLTGLPPDWASPPSTACGGALIMVLSSGERKDLFDGILMSLDRICRDERGAFSSVPVGSKYSGKIYVLYSYDNEINGPARLVTADITTPVQPS